MKPLSRPEALAGTKKGIAPSETKSVAAGRTATSRAVSGTGAEAGTGFKRTERLCRFADCCACCYFLAGAGATFALKEQMALPSART